MLSKFRQWLADTLRVDYETIAKDVQGLAEHVEEEFNVVKQDIEDKLQALVARIEHLEHPVIIPTNDSETENGSTGA